MAILDSGSHGEMYVNGQPRAANIYGRNYFHIPVLLNRGTNHLLLKAGRREFKIKLYDPPEPVFLNKNDLILPDLVVGREVEFVTANPAVGNACHCLAIEGRIKHHDLSKAHVHTWPNKRIFKGTTENVAVGFFGLGWPVESGEFSFADES